MSARDDSASNPPAPIAARPMGVEQRAESALNGGASPPRKRARVDGAVGSVGTGGTEALRRRILEYKVARLRALRDRATEQLSELYFLQAGGNMVEMSAWQRRSPAGLTTFLESHRPPPLAPPPPDPPPALEVVVKAKQEALVARRVAELARQGLWAERRLPRIMEPPRPKTHWDYLLEEMTWLAQDFAHERKWKKQAAKKCARAVQKHFQDKALAAQKAEKAQELHLKRLAGFAAKEIRSFWTNVEKLVEWKRTRRVERARKRALDARLSDIVGRTEQYSRALAANLSAPPAAPPSPPPSPTDDYGPSGEDSADDEGTIAEQERTETSDHAAELAALRDEAELGIDELVRRYNAPPTQALAVSNRRAIADSNSGSDSDTDSSSSEDAPPLESLVQSDAEEQGAGAESGEKRVEACSSLAAALQPTGYTLADTAVATPVPLLIKHSLREYQHVGLHWLATMHARRLNGILADEMGLGKTIQTIALLAHLALERGEWGPHLVVAPTSVVLNWELEFKKWCPAFKLLVYYGNIKERKAKRQGWTKVNAFHVCITSYKLVVQDHQSFRRKRWQYLVLDEAQNIKNFKSQRWQTLLNFQTERRLLLTGTPLQNSLLELWSLMHFLMPSVFASHTHFREWFGEVAAGAGGEGVPSAKDEALVRRLHRVLRPFLLRRLKADVERQMPRKFEHVLMCRLARRQRALYDDFMARAHTKASLASGNLLSVINVLMQLRKVCNHPDLFEPRPVASPLALPSMRLALPVLVLGLAARREEVAARLGGNLATLETSGAGAFAAHRARHLAPPRRLIERLLERPPPAPRPPPARLRLHLRLIARTIPPTAPLPPLATPLQPAAPAATPPQPTAGVRARLAARQLASLRRLAAVNERRCWRLPLLGSDLRAAVAVSVPSILPHRSLESVLQDMHHLIDRFTICWEAARAPAAMVVVGGGAAEWRATVAAVGAGLHPTARNLLATLHVPASRRAVAFPHPRLLQYDCGKLQTLDALLRRLKAGSHRVLIFTQMTRVLDVLEAFLSLHGHTYLRLDGSTRVDARQPLVERFNGDARVFAMILSTRSGGVGLNLTGADAVVFYDSDWNPTMDAQAQDRAHRIGQTRDVHVYRLVTQGTVEENILRKADQKRALGHRAIEDGHFTTSYLRKDNISELFGCDAASSAASAASAADGPELETALAAAEDEADAAAAARARSEQNDELAEFDETRPLPADDEPRRNRAHSPSGDPDAALMDQLSPVERYAMRLVESSEAASEADRAALDGMRRALERPERRAPRVPPPPVTLAAPLASPLPPQLTYSAAEARSKVWASEDQSVGLWAPPTPPRHAADMYNEQWARPLYRAGAAPDCALPATRTKRRMHTPRAAVPPPSLFEQSGPRPRLYPHAVRAQTHPPAPEWSAAEDAALRRAIRLQRITPEQGAVLAANWEWVAELVNDVSTRAYRSPSASCERADALADSERARRKHRKPSPRRRQDDEPRPRPPLARLDAMREASERRRAQPKRRLDDKSLHNHKHSALLLEYGVNYDSPPTPMDVAIRRADRIAKEKLKMAQTPATVPPAATAGGGTAGAGSAVPPPAVAAPSPPAPVTPVPAAPIVAPPTPRLLLAAPDTRRAAPALYRPPTTTRHHLKILQHGQSHPDVGGATLRTLQLQQLQLRRGSGAGSARLIAPRHSHVVVAHLAPAVPALPSNVATPPNVHRPDDGSH